MITVLLVLAAIISSLLGAIVFFQQPRVPSVIFFFLTMLGTTVWSIGIAIFLTTSSKEVLETSAVIYYIAAAIIAWSTLLFSITFARDLNFSKVRIAYLTLPLLAITGALWTNPWLLLKDVHVASSNTADLNMSFYLIYIVYFAVYYIGALAILLKRSHTKNKVLHRHFKSVFIAYGSAGVIGMLFNLFLPAAGMYELIWAGPLGLLLFVPIVYLAIAKYGLFDIRQTVVRTVAYLTSLLVLAAIYYLLAYLVSITLFKGEVNSSFSVSPINILLALLLAFIFQPIKRFFDKVTNNIFYRDSYNSDEFFARLSGLLTSTTDLRVLLERAAYEISATLKADQAFFFVYHMENHHISAGTNPHNHLPIKDARELDGYAKIHGDGVIVTELLTSDVTIQRLLESHKISVLLPLNRKDSQIIGYLALGEQRANGYTKKDVRVLATISDELVIAIQNSLSVQEVKDINMHLQQRIEAATQDLRSSNAQLRHLDTTKDEFLSMASHQLRTPLTSVKGYISMVLEGDAGKITDMQKHLLGEAFTSSERMVHLIHDFLNVSRLQTGKFMLEQHPYDLVSLVKQEVDSLRHTAESRQLKLQFVTKVDELLLNIDENKIRQVIMNFIDNALYYSHENTVITIELIEQNDVVEVRIQDTGIGVPKSEQAQLFSKFYRASNARKQRPDGTGVGLYLAKKVITAHGGDVLFESKENKGSTFGFMMPLKKLHVELTDSTK